MSFHELPAELVLRVTEQLSREDRHSLSAVSSEFRRFLAPVLFQTLRFTNLTRDAESIDRAVTKYGRHTKRMIFECHLLPNDDDVSDDETLEDGFHSDESNTEHETSAPAGTALSPLVQGLLDGTRISGIKDVSILFTPQNNFEGENFDPSEMGGFFMHDEPENSESIANEEREYVWRRTMTGTIMALSNNNSIKSLEIQELPPRKSSFYAEPKWREFLGTLEDFDVSIWACQNSAGGHSNMSLGYSDFISALYRHIFKYLTSAKSVRIEADHDNPIGCAGMPGHKHLPFRPNAMPAIEHLTLCNCFIDRRLVDFLENKAQQLKSLTLENCFSAASWVNDPISWSDFFASLRRCKPIITTFSMTNGCVPLTEDEEEHSRLARHLEGGKEESCRSGFNASEVDQSGSREWEPPEDEPPELQDIRRRLRENSKLRLFPYVCLDDKYGMVFYERDMIMKHFEDGTDQKEYDALMHWIASNSATG